MAMCEEIKDFPIISGDDKRELIVQSLLNNNPKEQMSKVRLEEKFFDALYLGRTQSSLAMVCGFNFE
jgi:hypothetical protein